ncbi:MAG TPA: hypothetical protein VML50_10525 [Anaeromyxobacter sp.]|nr:hypothetical protein [Anaeromyxobacter sp.]
MRPLSAWAPLALALLAAPRAAAPAGETPGAAPALTFTGKPFPPPGLPGDQALLREMLLAHRDMLDERAWALRALQRLGDARTDLRLAEAARAAPPGDGPRLEALRARLVEAWSGAQELLTRPWPVDPRTGCRERGVAFEVLMGTASEPPGPARLVATRDQARRCLERQTVPVGRLREANRALRAALEEAQAALVGPRGTTATPPSPAPASGRAGP